MTFAVSEGQDFGQEILGLPCLGHQLGRCGELLHSQVYHSGLAGTVPGVPLCGLSQWLGFPFNMLASGWPDLSHTDS